MYAVKNIANYLMKDFDVFDIKISRYFLHLHRDPEIKRLNS